jgi:hypothetical protein
VQAARKRLARLVALVAFGLIVSAAAVSAPVGAQLAPPFDGNPVSPDEGRPTEKSGVHQWGAKTFRSQTRWR